MNKKAELAAYLVKSKGLLNPADQEAEIAKMAGLCPEATAREKGLADDVDKAYEVMLIQTNQQVAPTATVAPVATQPGAAISAQEELQISKTLLAQKDDRAAVSMHSSIDSLVLDRPDPKDIIPTGTKGMINKKSWETFIDKIEKGTYTVCPDDGEGVDPEKRIASTTNFNTLKAAFEAGTPVDVYIGKLATRPIGYIANLGNKVGKGAELKQMTREMMEQFLVMNTAGYILASDTKPGARLKYIQGHASNTNPGEQVQGKVILADANKKAAIESGSYEVSREATAEKTSQGCKSALQIRVTVKDKFMKDGTTPLTRTVRISLTAELPTVVRKPKFVDVFGTGERESNADLTSIPTGDQAKKISEAQRNAIAMLRKKAKDPMQLADVAEIADQLAAFDAPASQTPNVTM